MFKRFIREPLIHFLLIGAALFGISSWVNKNSRQQPAENERVIVIDSNVTNDIRRQYKQHNGTKPTAAEMETLIADYTQREMLYREAMATGLDKNNDSLKALLAGQMSVAYTADKPIDPPTDEEIQQMLADKSWYVNDSGLPDTSQAFLQTMKPKLWSRYRQQKTAAQLKEKMKTLNAKYQIIRKGNQ